MNKWVAVFLVALCIATVFAEKKERKCVDGEKHFDGCNHCTCDHGIMSCTLMTCKRDGIELEKIPPPEDFWESEEEKHEECIEGRRYYDGCNYCNCVSGGLACTRMYCPGTDGKQVPVLLPEDEPKKEERKCVDGKSYNDGCNNCVCANGKEICTRMYCPEPKLPPPADFWEPKNEPLQPKVRNSFGKKKRKCVEGRTFYDGCNYCYCAFGNVVCTKMYCFGLNGKQKPKGPTPTLTPTLTPTTAPAPIFTTTPAPPTTPIPAPAPALVDFSKPEELKERRCIEGKTYYDGCNNCYCTNGNEACTLMFCPGSDGKQKPRLPAPADFWKSEALTEFKQRKCVSGKMHFDGCNSCFCSFGVLTCSNFLCYDWNGREWPTTPIPADFWES